MYSVFVHYMYGCMLNTYFQMLFNLFCFAKSSHPVEFLSTGNYHVHACNLSLKTRERQNRK